MANGGDGDREDDGGVVSPEELDITEQEDVAALGEGRFVVGADGAPNVPADAVDPDPEPRDASGGNSGRASPEESSDSEPATSESADTAETEGAASQPTADEEPSVSGRDVKRWLDEELESHDSEYAYHIAAKADHEVAHQQLATNDIGAAFDGLLVWYARQLASGTSIDEALGILLAASSVQPRYPTRRLVEYVESHDLGPDDTIRDLVEVVASEDGLAFPPRE